MYDISGKIATKAQRHQVNTKYRNFKIVILRVFVSWWQSFSSLNISTIQYMVHPKLLPFNKLKIFILLFLLSSFFLSCKNEKPSKKQINPAEYKEPLMKVNKKLVKSEDEQIEDYINRYGWNMKKTGTGLRYMIYKQGNGQKAETGKVAVIQFTVSLLNGDTCYTSESDEYKEFLIGKGGVESGLEEGILLLKKGDRAKFIIPSHLAFGLTGDMDKIPAKATLVYDIKLLKLN